MGVAEGMGATFFAVVGASEHKRWSNTKSANASLSGVARSDASNADDVATTTLASDLPLSNQKIKFCHQKIEFYHTEDLILSLWHVHVILFPCATLRWSYLVILAFDQQSTQMITHESIRQLLTRHNIGHFWVYFS